MQKCAKDECDIGHIVSGYGFIYKLICSGSQHLLEFVSIEDDEKESQFTAICGAMTASSLWRRVCVNVESEPRVVGL